MKCPDCGIIIPEKLLVLNNMMGNILNIMKGAVPVA